MNSSVSCWNTGLFILPDITLIHICMVLIRSTASLVSYFQVNRTQPAEPSLLVIRNESSSDETVVLSDSESSSDSSNPTEDDEGPARSSEEIPLIGLEGLHCLYIFENLNICK